MLCIGLFWPINTIQILFVSLLRWGNKYFGIQMINFILLLLLFIQLVHKIHIKYLFLFDLLIGVWRWNFFGFVSTSSKEKRHYFSFVEYLNKKLAYKYFYISTKKKKNNKKRMEIVLAGCEVRKKVFLYVDWLPRWLIENVGNVKQLSKIKFIFYTVYSSYLSRHVMMSKFFLSFYFWKIFAILCFCFGRCEEKNIHRT